MQLFSLSDSLKSDPVIVKENAERSFDQICRAFRVSSLNLEIVYYLIKNLKENL